MLLSNVTFRLRTLLRMPALRPIPPLRRMALPIVLVPLALAAACRKSSNDRPRYVPAETPEVLGVSADELRPSIAARLETGKQPQWVTAPRWKQARELYRTFGDSPIWLEPDGVNERAKALLRAIERAPEDGLAIDAYPLDSIRAVVERSTGGQKPSAEALADADVMLTSAYVAYAADMLRGQIDPRSVSQEWHIASTGKELDSALVHSLESVSMDSALNLMAPQDADYSLLRTAFADYKKIAGAGGWPTVPAGAALRPRAAAPAERLTALRARLQVEGFLMAGDTAATLQTRYDSVLAGAVAQFQKRHGFRGDSILGPETVRALNVTAQYRAEQLGANLERHRWLPRALGSRYIYVNVPSFRLDAYDGGQQVLTMAVVVGDEFEDKATPAFSDSMETVVFRPYWNITDNIATTETWPKIKKDPGYMAANNLETYKDGGVTRIRQLPGDQNSLGLVKFLFPNSFNIYLHDTPEKTLFAKANRAASHGCIRVQHPDQLAHFVLGWEADSLKQLMTAGPDNNSVRLPSKIPVYIVYFTAYGRDGQLHFADDLYGRDDALERRISGAPDRAAP